MPFLGRVDATRVLSRRPARCFSSLRRAIGDWYPFFSKALGDEPTAGRNQTATKWSASPAPAGNQHQQASRRPSPPRAPLPRRRVRRGCADPAPPAGPSGAAGSGQPLGTLRSPPRPRGGANRAGERVPRSRTYNSQRGGSGSTEIWPLTNFWPGSIYIVLRWSLIPSYNRQNALVNFSLPVLLQPGICRIFVTTYTRPPLRAAASSQPLPPLLPN